jgi:hypothetical protein
LSRSFRVYQKKRGHRRTGSSAAGRVGEAVFFGVFFLLGCAGLATILETLILPQWRANNEFVETTCIVCEKTLAKKQGEDGFLYRPEVAVEYKVDGKPRRASGYDICGAYASDRDAEQVLLDEFEVGGQYRCWYDPLKPDVVVLVRGYSWWVWLLLMVPISFMLIGGAGAFYCAWNWGKSAEYSKASGGPMALVKLGAGGERVEFPTVPTPADMTNSPGTTLQFRLPISSSATLRLVVVLGACLFWNGIVAVFIADVVKGFIAKEPNWLETLFVAPFALVGLALVYAFFRQLLIASGVGPTLLEISDHPLYPNHEYELFLSQAGRLRLRSLELSLVATEEARYRQGTDTRVETQRVYRQSLFRQEDFEIRGGVPLEVRCSLAIPHGTMHSFKSENNSLTWSLVVEGKVIGWPDYERSFPVVVYPEPLARADA